MLSIERTAVKITTRMLGVGAVTGLLALGVGGTAMAADPATPSDTALVAVGSDTTQDVMGGLAAAIGGGTTIANYDATGGGTISTRTAAHAPCQSFHRPNGSGDGKNALTSAAGNAANGTNYPTALRDGSLLCVDVARSSSAGFPTKPATATGTDVFRRYEFAIDSVTYATLQTTSVPKQLNIADLKAYYTANGTPGTTACVRKKPLIPQGGSGTRGFWAGVIGVTDTALTDARVGTPGFWGTCVRDTVNGVSVEEHNGTFLADGQTLAPFSVAQFISQGGGVAANDLRGNASLGSIDWTSASGTANVAAPVVLQQSFGAGTRTVYNFVPKDAVVAGNVAGTNIPVNPLIATTFGAGGSICQNSALIQRYGFGVDPTCGAFSDGSA